MTKHRKEQKTMAKEKHYILTRDEARRQAICAIDEIYNAQPVKFRFELSGAVDEVPMMHVEYDCYAYDAKVGRAFDEHGHDVDL